MYRFLTEKKNLKKIKPNNSTFRHQTPRTDYVVPKVRAYTIIILLYCNILDGGKWGLILREISAVIHRLLLYSKLYYKIIRFSHLRF
jgi:hypothetical protein